MTFQNVDPNLTKVHNRHSYFHEVSEHPTKTFYDVEDNQSKSLITCQKDWIEENNFLPLLKLTTWRTFLLPYTCKQSTSTFFSSKVENFFREVHLAFGRSVKLNWQVTKMVFSDMGILFSMQWEEFASRLSTLLLLLQWLCVCVPQIPTLVY